MEHQVLLVLPDLLDPKDHKDHREMLVQRDLTELLGLMVRNVSICTYGFIYFIF